MSGPDLLRFKGAYGFRVEGFGDLWRCLETLGDGFRREPRGSSAVPRTLRLNGAGLGVGLALSIFSGYLWCKTYLQSNHVLKLRAL